MVKKKNAQLLIPNNGSKSVDILKESLANSKDDILYLSFTINPEEQFYECDEKDRFLLWTDRLYKYLKTNTKYCVIELYPEVSAMGRLHAHGIISILDDQRLMFQMYDVPSLARHGHIEIDTIKEMEVWRNYITKQVLFIKTYTEINRHYDNDGAMRIRDLV